MIPQPIDRPNCRPRKTSFFLIVVALPLLCLVSNGCGKKTIEGLRKKSSDLNVILITIDSLRKSHLEIYGYRSLRTPALSELAANGIVFNDAVTTAPVSFPANASILTGLYTPNHKARHTGTHRLPDSVETLAEIFRDAGYSTGATVGSAALNTTGGLDQGFETFDDRFKNREGTVVPELTERVATRVTDSALQFIQKHKEGRFFSWIHYADPRHPYRAPEVFYLQAQSGDDFSRQYDAEIAYVDSEIGRLLSRLEGWGMLADTVIVVAGSHGESFGGDDHSEPFHGNFLYESTVAVPMLISAPSVLPGERVIESVASVVDIAPTILDIASLQGAGASMDGKSRLAEIFDPELPEDVDRTVYIETLYPLIESGWSPMYAIRNSSYKLIVSPIHELFDLRADPAETKNLYEVQDALAIRLYQDLEVLVGEAALSPSADPAARTSRTEQSLSQLERMGYIGDFPKIDEERLLDDVKNNIYVAIALIEARNNMRPGQNEPRFEEMVNFLRENRPTTGRVLSQLGGILVEREDYEAAAEVLERAIEHEPTFGRPHLLLAQTRQALEEPREALALLDKAIELDPKSIRCHMERGRVLAILFRPEEAQKAFQTAIELDPLYNTARIELGHVLTELGQTDEASEMYDSVLRNRPRNIDSLFGKAALLEKLEKTSTALSVYVKIIPIVSRQPNNIEALNKLVEAMERLDQPVAKLKLLQTIAQKTPQDTSVHLAMATLLAGQLEDPKRAVERLDLILQLDSENVDAMLLKAVLLRENKSLDEAATIVGQALALDDSNPDALRVLGLILNDQGKTPEAIATIEKALIDDSTGEAHNELGWILITATDETVRDVNKAVDVSQRAIELAPDLASFHDTHVRALAQAERYDDARTTCLDFLKSHTTDAMIHSTLADIQKMSGDNTAAADYYTRASELHKTQGRLRIALIELGKAIEIQPENQTLLDFRTDLQEQRQKRQQQRRAAEATASKKTP